MEIISVEHVGGSIGGVIAVAILLGFIIALVSLPFFRKKSMSVVIGGVFAVIIMFGYFVTGDYEEYDKYTVKVTNYTDYYIMTSIYDIIDQEGDIYEVRKK